MKILISKFDLMEHDLDLTTVKVRLDDVTGWNNHRFRYLSGKLSRNMCRVADDGYRYSSGTAPSRCVLPSRSAIAIINELRLRRSNMFRLITIYLCAPITLSTYAYNGHIRVNTYDKPTASEYSCFVFLHSRWQLYELACVPCFYWQCYLQRQIMKGSI